MKIKVIMTDKAMDRETMDQREKMLSAAVSKGVSISVDCIKKGPDELDCNTDEAFAAPELVKESIKAEQEGYDAIVIYCFSDVGIDAVRENVRIPVIGPGETSLCAASLLCSRFVVITTESANIPRTYRRLMRNGIAREKMTSVRALDIPIGELRADPGATARYLKQVCEKAVREEQADGYPGLPGHGRLWGDAGKGASGQGHRPCVYRACICGDEREAGTGACNGSVPCVSQRQPCGTVIS